MDMKAYLAWKREEDRREEEERQNRLYGAALAVLLIAFWCFCAALFG